MSNASSEPKIEPSRPVGSWNAWWGVFFTLLLYVGSQLVASLLIWLYPWLRGWSQPQAENWLNHSVVAQFAYLLLASAFILLAVRWFLRRQQLGWQAIGLRRPQSSDVGWGLLALPVYILLYLLIVTIAVRLAPGLDLQQQQQLGFDHVSGSLALTMTFISLVVLPPLTEEIMVRGLLYSSFKKLLPLMSAALMTSLIFAAAHLPEGGDSGPLYIAALDTFALSLVLIYLREKTGGLWASMTLHALKNGIAFVTLFLLQTH